MNNYNKVLFNMRICEYLHNIKDQLEKMLLREKRMEIFKECLNFLYTIVTLDQN